MLIVILGLYALCNLIVFCTMPLTAMYEDLWKNQRLVGKITATIFYNMAWVLKGLFYGAIICCYWIIWLDYKIAIVLFKFFKWLYNKVFQFSL